MEKRSLSLGREKRKGELLGGEGEGFFEFIDV